MFYFVKGQLYNLLQSNLNSTCTTLYTILPKHETLQMFISPALLQEHNISPTQFGQVVSDWCSYNTPSTDYHTGLTGQWEQFGIPTCSHAVGRYPQAPARKSVPRLRKQQPGEQDRGQSPGAHSCAFCNHVYKHRHSVTAQNNNQNNYILTLRMWLSNFFKVTWKYSAFLNFILSFS